MRPLETHVQISSQLMMFNRVKDMLLREGKITPESSNEELCRAFKSWSEAMTEASHQKIVRFH